MSTFVIGEVVEGGGWIRIGATAFSRCAAFPRVMGRSSAPCWRSCAPRSRAGSGTPRYVALTAHNLEGARRLVELLTAPTRPAEVRAFGHLALAHLALAAGRAGHAEASLDRAARLDPVAALEHRGLIGLIPFLYAGMLEEQDRPEEALRWYGAFSANSLFDLVYLAPARARQGAILARLGRAEEAGTAYREALGLWANRDPELAPVLREAELGVAR